MDCYSIIKEICIPVISASIGGMITLIGVRWTIINENRKAEKAYKEQIRPFFIVEPYTSNEINPDKLINAHVIDDSVDSAVKGRTIYSFCDLILTNASDNVCTVSYIKINGKIYPTIKAYPIKPGEIFNVKGIPLSWFLTENELDTIYLGIMDRQFNHYEYEVLFTVVEETNEKLSGNTKKVLFDGIDCSKNLYPDLHKSKRNKRKQ